MANRVELDWKQAAVEVQKIIACSHADSDGSRAHEGLHALNEMDQMDHAHTKDSLRHEEKRLEQRDARSTYTCLRATLVLLRAPLMRHTNSHQTVKTDQTTRREQSVENVEGVRTSRNLIIIL